MNLCLQYGTGRIPNCWRKCSSSTPKSHPGRFWTRQSTLGGSGGIAPVKCLGWTSTRSTGLICWAQVSPCRSSQIASTLSCTILPTFRIKGKTDRRISEYVLDSAPSHLSRLTTVFPTPIRRSFPRHTVSYGMTAFCFAKLPTIFITTSFNGRTSTSFRRPQKLVSTLATASSK